MTKFDMKDFTIRELATRIANDAIKIASLEATVEMLKLQEGADTNGNDEAATTNKSKKTD